MYVSAAASASLLYVRAAVVYGSHGVPCVCVHYMVYNDKDVATNEARADALVEAERAGVATEEVVWSTDARGLPPVMWQPTFAGVGRVVEGYWAARPGASHSVKTSVGFHVVMRVMTCRCPAPRAAPKYVAEATPELCLAAVQHDRCALQFVGKQTPEVCLAAVTLRDACGMDVDDADAADAAVAAHGGELLLGTPCEGAGGKAKVA